MIRSAISVGLNRTGHTLKGVRKDDRAAAALPETLQRACEREIAFRPAQRHSLSDAFFQCSSIGTDRLLKPCGATLPVA